MVTMYGPAFDNTGTLVERSVSDADVPAFERAGYVKGSLPGELKPKDPGVIEVPEELKGKLPEDFPGHAALDAAGIHTYAQLRKAGDVTEVSGIGKATATKIAEALASTPEEPE